MADHGSRKPLNWRTPPMAEPVKKALSHEDKLDIHSRAGTPVTTRGSFNGTIPGLRPSLTPELNPPLVLSKAVRTPVKYGADGSPQFERKRGQDGKFAQAENSGTSSTAQDDAAKDDRSAELQEHRMRDQQRTAAQRSDLVSRGKQTSNPSVKNKKEGEGLGKALGASGQGGQVPGTSSNTSLNMVNDPVSKQIGVAQSGAPIFDDPNHSEHAEFAPEDHADAANTNRQAAQAAMQQGDQAGAMRMTNNAAIHDSMGQDSSNPSTRFLDSMMDPSMQTPSMDDLPQDDLSSLIGGSPAPVGQDPMAAGGPDPMVAGGPDPMGAPQPSMGAQPPQMAATGTPPMDPMSAPPTGAPAGPPDTGMAAPPTPAPGMMPPPGAPPSPPMGAAPPQDALSAFVDPAADQNKPAMGGPTSGPAPGMLNSATGTPVGPQTNVPQFAGTAPQPQPPAAAQAPMDPMGQGPMGAPPAPPMGAGMPPDPNAQAGMAPPAGPQGEDHGALDLDSLFGGADTGGMPEQDPTAGGGMPQEGDDVGGDDGGNPFGGEDTGGGEDAPPDEGPPQDDAPPAPDKEKEVKDATDKAIKALARYLR